MLGAEGKLICCRCKVVFGAQMCNMEGNEFGELGISSFQLDHINPKRPTMSQGRSYKDYLHAYEQGHIKPKCYECIGTPTSTRSCCRRWRAERTHRLAG